MDTPYEKIITKALTYDNLVQIMRVMIRRAGEGGPKAGEARNLLKIVKARWPEVRQALINGLRQGQNPKVIAREVKKVTTLSANAAETITRTTIMNASNMAHSVIYAQAGIKKMRIIAALDADTCAEFLYRDGNVISVRRGADVTLHPNCRCTIAPVVDWPEGERSGKEYDDEGHAKSKLFPADTTGKEYLRNLPQEQQEKVLGYDRVRLMNAGEVKFDDLWNTKGELIPLKTLSETSQHGG